MIQCTAGTTVLGSYDDIDAACDIAAEHKMWVHVDGCWGGSVALSKTHKHLLTGVERADSFAWNPHKMMGIPLQCCAFLTQELGILQEAHSANAKSVSIWTSSSSHDVRFWCSFAPDRSFTHFRTLCPIPLRW